MDQLFDNFGFELLKSFVYGVILAALGQIVITFWRSMRGGMAAIPSLKQQVAELFRLQRDGASGRVAFGPWLVARDLIRIAIFVGAIVAIGLLVSELLLMVAQSDQTLRSLDRWGTITLRRNPIPVPVFAVAFLASFFLAYLPLTGRIIGAVAVWSLGAVCVAMLVLIFRFFPVSKDVTISFAVLHELFGGLSNEAVAYGEGNWFLPILHISVPAIAFLISLYLGYAILRASLVLFPDIWRRALAESRVLSLAVWLVGIAALFALFVVMQAHGDELAWKFSSPGSLDTPLMAVFVAAAVVGFLLASRRSAQSLNWIK